MIPLIFQFPKVPQSSLGILRVPQLPPPLGHPLKNLMITWQKKTRMIKITHFFDFKLISEMLTCAISKYIWVLIIYIVYIYIDIDISICIYS